MLPIFLTILLVVIPIAILKPFSRLHKIIVFAVILLYLAATFVGHSLLLAGKFPGMFAAEKFEKGPPGYPIVIDSSVDAIGYYDRTRIFEDHAPFSITKQELVNVAGGRQHLGYYYVIGNLSTITAHPVLALRLLKTLIFFVGLACLMRVWRYDYGDPLPMYGFIFLALLYLVPLHYIFRNLKDGLLFGLFLILMALVDTLLRPSWQRPRPVTKSRLILGWLLVLALLWAIATLRYYYSVAFAIAIVMHLITASGLSARARAGLLALAGVASLFVLRAAVTKIFTFLEANPIANVSVFYHMFRGLVTPIPWQYFIRWLIPAHCFYLLLLPFAAIAFFARFRKNLTWHLYTVLAILYVLGGMLKGDSSLRKRLVMVPIFVMWVLAYLAHKRGTHIEQTQPQLLTQADQLDESLEYEPQPESAY